MMTNKFLTTHMQTYTPINHTQKRKALIFALLGSFIVLAGIAFFLLSRSSVFKPQKPPDFTPVSAVSGNTITLTIKTDAAGPYVEYNGEKINMSNMLGSLKTNTEYTLEIANTTHVKQGLFIPAKQLSILVDPGQSDNKNRVTFTSPGTFFFLPASYQAGWENLKSGFIVQSDNTLDVNTCQCDLWNVVEQNCTPPNEPQCTNKFSCACSPFTTTNPQ